MSDETPVAGEPDETTPEVPLEGTIEGAPRPPVEERDPDEPEHPSDYPGREYPGEGSPDRGKFTSAADRSHSSGLSNPSEPRRPGTGERQAPLRSAPTIPDTTPIVPGEIFLAGGPVIINDGLPVTTLRVANTADRPIQVGSHFHFYEVNAALDFERGKAWGQRLNVLSGGAVRFEPGAVVEVELVPIRGRRIVRGLRGLCKGELDG
ncbi:MAG: urease subunit beta [Gordonia sp. (in: high G+C Gram-positive bacteria)]